MVRGGGGSNKTKHCSARIDPGFFLGGGGG